MERTVKITKALADRNRLRTVMVLMEHQELCVCQITEMLGLATPTVSRHMSILQNACLVKSRKEGRWVYYRLTASFPKFLEQWLKEELMQSKDLAKDIGKIEEILVCK